MAVVIGIDIGGSKIAAGLVSNNKILKKKVVQTPKTGKEILSAIINIIEDVGGNVKQAKGIGIGVAGSVDSKGNWLKSPNIPCVNNIPLKRILEKRFHKSVEINNDANCFALEEALIGSGKGKISVFGLILGTGTGGGIVIDRKLYNGADYLAGEVGMINMRCKNGDKMIKIEDLCSARFVRQMAARYGLKMTRPKEVAELALKGDKKAIKIYSKLGENVGYLLSIIICTLNPDIVIIGGGLSGSFGLFRQSMLNSMKDNLFYKKTWKTRIVKSASKEAGIVGAAALMSAS